MVRDVGIRIIIGGIRLNSMRIDILNDEGVKVASLKSKVVRPALRKRRDGTSLRTQQRRRKQLGISNSAGRPEQIEWDKIKSLCLDRYNRGDAVGDICKDSGISVSSFYRVVLNGGSNV